MFPHAPDDQTEADGEDHHAQGVYPVHRTRYRNHLLLSQLLAPVEAEDGFVHRHPHHDHFVSVLRLELESGGQHTKTKTYKDRVSQPRGWDPSYVLWVAVDYSLEIFDHRLFFNRLMYRYSFLLLL